MKRSFTSISAARRQSSGHPSQKRQHNALSSHFFAKQAILQRLRIRIKQDLETGFAGSFTETGQPDQDKAGL